MNKADHHNEAERLLSDAREEHDSIRRSVILAEAQVHASLALSAEPGTSLPDPGQPEPRSTSRGEEFVLVPAELLPYLRYLPGRRRPAEPGEQPGDITPRSPSGGSPVPWSDLSQIFQEAERMNWEAYIKTVRGPQRRRRRPAEQPEDLEAAEPGEQEPDATKQPPAPDNPAGQEPGKPDEPGPGGFRPF